jgi:hypothetical protein
MNMRPSLSALEIKLQSKLNLPRRRPWVARSDAIRVAVRARSVEDHAVREEKILMVENVKELGPELQAEQFRKLVVLGERDIGIEETGAPQ